jgi:hypothetical protein
MMYIIDHRNTQMTNKRDRVDSDSVILQIALYQQRYEMEFGHDSTRHSHSLPMTPIHALSTIIRGDVTTTCRGLIANDINLPGVHVDMLHV